VEESTRRWEKFPNFIEYANDRVTFQINIEATRTRAMELALHVFIYPNNLIEDVPTKNLLYPAWKLINRMISDISKWSNDFIWKTLEENQSEFRMLLDEVIKDEVISEHFQCLQKHATHISMQPSWANMGPPRVGATRLARPANSSVRYYECRRIQDPLDGIYWELQEFLRLGGEFRLRKCPICMRYFVQPTSRPQTYCDAKCRLKGDPSLRKANAEYQRRHREQRIL
jgi:hypothetical protein